MIRKTTTERGTRIEFRFGKGASVRVAIERIADGAFVSITNTDAPGWGGAYGMRRPIDAGRTFPNEFNATLGGLKAARRYWSDKQVERLVAAIDEIAEGWFYEIATPRITNADDSQNGTNTARQATSRTRARRRETAQT